MSNKFFYLICLGLVLALGGFAQAEMLVNPGFEADLEGWNTWGGGSGSGAGGWFYNSDTHATVMEDGTANSGEKYVEVGIAGVEGSLWGVMLAFQEQPVTEGKVYEISGWFRDGDADGAPSLVENGGKIEWEWRDAAPTSEGRGAEVADRNTLTFNLTEEWTYQSDVQVAPPGAKGLTVVLGTTWGGINLDIDDASFGPAQVAIPVADAGFDDHVLAEGDWIYIGDPGYTGAWQNLFMDSGDMGAWVDNGYYAADVDLPALSGNNKAYGTYNADDYIYQILDETYVEGATYTFGVSVGAPWEDYDDSWSLYFTTDDYTDELASIAGNGPIGEWGQASLEYTATAADAGKKIGIKMKGADYVNFEDITLYGHPKTRDPIPADGTMIMDTWISLGWTPASFAVTNDIYVGDNFDDVSNGAGDTFRRNQEELFYFVGFAGGAYPEGLVNGMTYYWRIDAVNDSHPDSPLKGDVWSFSVVSKTAYNPTPAAGAEFVNLNATLSWTAGFGAKIHYIVFGEDFDEVNDAETGVINGTTTYNPGPLELAKTYYWRVDESDGAETLKGDVWSFTTTGAVSGPNPADGAVDIKPTVVLRWDAGAVAASHEVYFGTDADAVKNATTASPEYKGPKALGEESYDPGKLMLNSNYYWRIDEVNGVNPDSPWAGNVWSFTTGDFLVIDDFEIYDAEENQIWWSWKDGLGYVAHGNEPAYPGNGTGSAVGDETTDSYTEETIVHGGLQSMPLVYDNNKQGYDNYSEAELTLTDQRNWTEQGVAEWSLWFRGNPASVGSFIENPVGTYTMTATGADIWNQADEFHFAYKMLTGTGTIIAKVESVSNSNAWAKAGVMIRETLEADSKHAMMVVTPGSGVSFQRRPETGGDSLDDTTGNITAPYWVKLERDIAGNFSAYSSANGSVWQKLGLAEPIQMSANAYIGLAVTSHNPALTCQAVFTNVTTSGNVSGQWMNQDIGIESNDAEPLYVAVSNSTGAPVVVVHDDPAAANLDTWTEWVIPLQVFVDQGIVLTDVDKIAIGLGIKDNMAVPGGSGKMYIDDVRLNQPSDTAAE